MADARVAGWVSVFGVRKRLARRRLVQVQAALLASATLVVVSLVSAPRAGAGAGEVPVGSLVPSVANYGRTLGDFSVSGDGAAQYSLPLWVAAGRGLVAPRLALSYSSSGGNGLLGVGWSLSGLSSVTRCPRSIALDGVTDGVRWNSSDRFCLGGDRLMPVGGVVSGEQVYRTERDGFAKVVATGMGDGEPDTFKVWSKDRTVLTFGATAASKLQAFRLTVDQSTGELVPEPNTARQTLAWQLNRIEDRNGNAATVEYTEHEGSAALGWHVESRPHKITYPPNREVEFVYQDRTDPIVQFARGVQTKEPKRLWKVIARGAPNGKADREVLRTYELSYRDDSITHRSLLSSVTETDRNGTPNRPLTFDWSMGSYDFDSIPTGVSDCGRYNGPNWDPPPALPNNEIDNRIVVADINGDGRDDIACPQTLKMLNKDSHPRQDWVIRLSNGNGFGSALFAGLTGTTEEQCPAEPTFCPGWLRETAVQLVDYDLDRRMDALIEIDDGSPRLADNTGGSGWRLFRSNGSKWVADPLDIDGTADGAELDPEYFGDINGDGTPDFIRGVWDDDDPDNPVVEGTIDRPWAYRLNTGDNNQRWPLPVELPSDQTLRFQTPAWSGSGGAGYNTNKLLDIDGDGRVDFLGFNTDLAPAGWSLNVGGGYSERRFTGTASLRSMGGDVNGDGLPDAIRTTTFNASPDAPPVKGKVRAALNSGSGFGPYSVSPDNFYEPTWCCQHAPINAGFDRGVRIVDFNGDGADDVLLFRVGAPDNVDDAVNGVQLYTWRNGAFERAPLSHFVGRKNERGFQSTQVLDIDGDGMLDIVYMDGEGPHGTGDQLRVLKRLARCSAALQSARCPGRPDLLVGIADVATGPRVEVTYSTLSDTTVHTPCTGSFPLVCPVSGSSVVKQHMVANLVGTNTVWDSYTHTYQHARSHVQGRGWLGFAKHTVTRAATGATTVTEFDNTTVDTNGTTVYPFAFLPKKVTTTVTDSADPATARESRTTVTSTPALRRTSGNAYTVEIGKQVSTEEERPAGGAWTLLRSTTTTTTFDAYGNEDLVTTQVAGGRRLTEDPTFRNDTASWLLGLPTKTLTTGCVTATSGCVTRETDLDYDDKGNHTLTVVEPNTAEPEGGSKFTLTTTTEYGDVGQVLSVTSTDSAGKTRTTTNEYADNEFGGNDKLYPTAVINAMGHRTEILTHSGLGVQLHVTDPNGTQTGFSYDGFGRPTLTQHADGSGQTIAYQALAGGVAKVTTTDAGGGVSAVVTDRLGREVQRQVKTFAGTIATTYTGYDALGRVSQVSRPTTDSTRQWTTTTYDRRDRVKTVTDPDGVVSATYSYLNLETHIVDGRGIESYTKANVNGDVASSFEPDPDPDSVTGWLQTKYTYDGFGQTKTVTAPDGTVQTMVYDVLGRRTSLAHPASAGTTTTTYTAFGQVATETNGAGQTSEFRYDELGRTTKITSPDGDDVYSYDTASNGIGKPVNFHSADGVGIDFRYDQHGRPSTTTWNIEETSYQVAIGYDEVGRPKTTTYPALPGLTVSPSPSPTGATGRFAATNVYNTNGYLSQVKNADSGQVYWTGDERNPAGQLTKETYGNGVVNKYTYDPNTGLLTSILNTGPGTIGTLGQYAFDYDSDRNVIQRHNLLRARDERFGYDELNRLTNWSTAPLTTPALDIDYRYDKAGNLASETVNEGPTTTRTYDYGGSTGGAHRLWFRSDGPVYTYDGAGRQTFGDGRSNITYNRANLPTTITRNDGQTTEFRYDANNTRVLKRNPTTTLITIAGLFERTITATGIHNVHNVVVDGRTVAQVDLFQTDPTAAPTASTFYLSGDHQNSTALITNSNGRTAGVPSPNLLTYDPFGRRIDNTNTPWPKGSYNSVIARNGYTSQLHDDDLGLIDMKGRVYDPNQRRFLTPDPIITNPLSSQQQDRYTYVQNNPVTLTDPTGLTSTTTTTSNSNSNSNPMRSVNWSLDARLRNLSPEDAFDTYGQEVLKQAIQVFGATAVKDAILGTGNRSGTADNDSTLRHASGGTNTATATRTSAGAPSPQSTDGRRKYLQAYAQQELAGPNKAQALLNIVAKSIALSAGHQNPVDVVIDDLFAVLIGTGWTDEEGRGVGPYFVGESSKFQGATGFKPQLRDNWFQVQHAAAGIIIGYKDWTGLVQWERIRAENREGQPQDAELYRVTFPIGEQMAILDSINDAWRHNAMGKPLPQKLAQRLHDVPAQLQRAICDSTCVTPPIR